MSLRLISLLGLILALAGCASITTPEQRTAQALDRIRDQPAALDQFLRAMPKGGDLHNHLAGAIAAESYLAWAAQDGLCIDPSALLIAAQPCVKGLLPAAAANADPALHARMVAALSMQGFVPGAETGHDHFFATFGKFHLASINHSAEGIAEVADRAAAEHIDYIELMDSPGMGEARKLGAELGWTEDFDHFRIAALPGIAKIVADTRRETDQVEARVRQILHCGTAEAHAGCGVTLRYIAQVIRTVPAEQDFGESLFGYALVAADARFVGVNLVAPEDDKQALATYPQQMRILGYLGKAYPGVKLTLHAGELAPGLVPAEDLRSHIRAAVEIAGARRIGHGVDILHEDDSAGLLREMAARKILVEINLTSNDLILGISGDAHPFNAYRAAGVPLALSTDDEGVSRIDLTHEFLRATRSYHLSYGDLKTLVRNSLDYSFLPGASLWQSNAPYQMVAECAAEPPGATAPGGACGTLLNSSERARLEWRLEREFAGFEAGR